MFLIKKTNTLLVPYLFFLLTDMLVTVGFYLKDIQGGWLNAYYSSMALHNGPIWFLLCLYLMSMLYYAVCYIKSEWIKTLLMLALSFLGYILGKYHVGLPLYIDIMLSSAIFYHCGYLFKCNNMLTGTKAHILIKFICSLVLFMIMILPLNSVPQLELANNDIPMPFYYYLLAGISGTLMVAFFSILIERFYVVNYWGKYSIIILCTHWGLIRIWGYILPYVLIQKAIVLWGIFAFVLLLSFPLIKLFVIYLPKYCGQTPFLKI